MSRRLILAVLAVFLATSPALGQLSDDANRSGTAWTGANERSSAAASSRPDTPGPVAPRAGLSNPSPRRIATVTAGSGQLPNEHGQRWLEYDISPYTRRVTSTNRPEQALVDWILLETGYEMWHSQPLGILSATPRTLRVYHTTEVQNVVADIVDRFVSSQAETQAFGLRVVTVDHPNWRAQAQRLLRPVQVEASGVQAWLIERENAAVLLALLRRRSDFREHSSPHLLVNNGQSSVVSTTRGRNYVSGVAPRTDGMPGYEQSFGVADEGFTLEFTPLLSLDGNVIDAVLQCNIDQVEKMVPVMIDVPSAMAPRVRTKIEVPQMTHFRFHERFRWPSDQVLLIGMGMVALPVPGESRSLIPGLPLLIGSSGPPRADLLVFVESKGNVQPASQVTRSRSRLGRTTY